jgi:Zn-dependent protease
MSTLDASLGTGTLETQNAAVVAEIKKLQNKRTSPWMAVLVLVVSVLLFMAASKVDQQMGNQSWQALAILVAVLFFHETGHFIAMKLLGYRNVQMFFIPFFGAAVSGRNYTAPGWKKVLVALMGPLPGVYAGGAVGIAGIVTGRPWMIQAGLMAVLLNAFNLLPVLPLDGGRVMQTLLFSRHHLADCAFRVLAALALVAIGAMLGQGQIMMYVGIGMLVGLPISYKIAKIAAHLRAGMGATGPGESAAGIMQAPPPAVAMASPPAPGIVPPPPTVLPPAAEAAIEDAAFGVPAAQANAIISKVRQAFPRKTKDKAIARYTLEVYELLNARPPGWLGTLTLAGLAGGTFVLALLLAVVLVIGQRADLGRFAMLSAMAPKHPVSLSSIRVVSGEQAKEWTGERKTLIATFKQPADAEKAFQEIGAAVPERSRVELFGQTLLAEIPAADEVLRRRWFRELEARKADVFVDSGQTEGTFVMQCIAPNESTARAIEEEAEEYFYGNGMFLVAPWDQDDTRSASERARHHVARQTYRKAMSAGAVDYDTAESKRYAKALREASRQGDDAEATRLRQEQRLLHEQRRQRELDAMMAQGPESVDAAVVERCAAYLKQPSAATRPAEEEAEEDNSKEYTRLMEDIAPRLGQVRMENGKPAPDSERYITTRGAVLREGLLLSFQWIGFKSPVDGAAALTKWLLQKGCIGAKYDFRRGFAGDDSPI